MHDNYADLEQDRANEPLADAFEEGRQQRDAEILEWIDELELVLDPEDNALHVSGWIAHKIKGGDDKTYFDDRIKRHKTRTQNEAGNKQL